MTVRLGCLSTSFANKPKVVEQTMKLMQVAGIMLSIYYLIATELFGQHRPQVSRFRVTAWRSSHDEDGPGVGPNSGVIHRSFGHCWHHHRLTRDGGRHRLPQSDFTGLPVFPSPKSQPSLLFKSTRIP